MKSKALIVLTFAAIIATGSFRSSAQNHANNYVAVENALNEIKIENEKLRKMNAVLETRLDQVERDLSQCCMNYQQGEERDNSRLADMTTAEFAKLEQNNPNPFTDRTVIKYYIPSSARKAFIKIYSVFGSEVLSFPINSNGSGQVEFSGKTLSAGTFTYILAVDGKAVDTKQMVLTR